MLAIALALQTKNVLLSLFGGIFLGLFILHDFSFLQTLEALVSLFTTLLTTPWILKTLGFALLVGSIMELIERSGGIEGFIEYLQNKKELVTSERSALLLSYAIGVLIFVESSITSLIAGAVGKPLCDRYKIPHAKLAYVCDSTSAPVCSLIVLNGWGALLLGLVTAQISLHAIDAQAVSLLIDGVLYNFYAMSALAITFAVIWFKIDIGPMRRATYVQHAKHHKGGKKADPSFMLLPLALMIVLVFVFLYLTGDGSIFAGSGSSSIFYTMLSTLLFTLLYFVGRKNMSLGMWSKTSLRGAKKLFPVTMILLFAFAIGEVTSKLQTGLYLASLVSETIDVHFLAASIFLLSSLISFATGTSWGTFSIMIPVAVPMALGVDANVALCIGAVISGGVFGDHCSPISDTTIISSMASDCEVVEHVTTQLPYALLSGFFALLLFIVISFY